MKSSSPVNSSEKHTNSSYFIDLIAQLVIGCFFKPFYIILSNTSIIFVITLAILIFSPPNIPGLPMDRVSFFLLFMLVICNSFFKKEKFVSFELIMLPMILLIGMATIDSIYAPFDKQTWSFLASKYVLPFVMFFLAKITFKSNQATRHFFLFSLIAVSYLIFIALASFAKASFLVYPRYILDTTIALHAERARGPFLQAVANGTAINMLGLAALFWFQKHHFRGIIPALFLISLPFAIFVTMTRAVWLSFISSLAIVFLFSKNIKTRKIICLLLLLFVIGAASVSLVPSVKDPVLSRLTQRGPIDIRFALYTASIEMFQERPIWGWGFNQSAFAIPDFLVDYDIPAYWIHNSYLEILVEQGLFGFTLYAAIIFYLVKIGTGLKTSSSLVDREFLPYWYGILVVYIINGMFVVMNYAFINALLFTLGGIVAISSSRMTQAKKSTSLHLPAKDTISI
jgi:O-antigen ligase